VPRPKQKNTSYDFQATFSSTMVVLIMSYLPVITTSQRNRSTKEKLGLFLKMILQPLEKCTLT
jgi:hypothetical protein